MVVVRKTTPTVALRHIDGDAGIIGICGMAGIDKTTLLRKINNSFLSGTIWISDFHHIIWVVASKDLNVHKLQQDIADKLGLMSLNTETETRTAVRTAAIRNFLKNKNFLLLLDDPWERLDLDNIGIPQARGDGKLKHKVIITTRSIDLCGNMEVHTRLEVECNDLEMWDQRYMYNQYRNARSRERTSTGVLWTPPSPHRHQSHHDDQDRTQ